MMLVVLSHPLGPDTPNWPGAPNFEMRPFHSISGGDIANTHVLEVYNRQGTHVAAPSHVNPEGATLSDPSPEYFVFERPVVVDLPLTDRQLIRPEDLDAYAGGPNQPGSSPMGLMALRVPSSPRYRKRCDCPTSETSSD